MPFGRAYSVETIDKKIFLPSVTTVLSLNIDKDLEELKVKLGPEKFKFYTDRAARRGTVMHKLMEDFLSLFNESKDMSANLMKSQKMFMADPEMALLLQTNKEDCILGKNLFFNFYHTKFWVDFKEVLHNELFMYTLFRGGWAGATDFIYRNKQGYPIVVDFKSSSSIKDVAKIFNYKIQIAVYMFKYADMFGEVPLRGEIWISNAVDTNIQKVVITRDEFKYWVKQFLVLRDKFEELPTWQEFKQSLN